MKSRITRSFLQQFARLPDNVQQQARQSHRLFVNDHQHPSLHFKRICANPPTYSARVGSGYRVVGGLDGDTVVWYWIGTHAEYDQLLKQR
jgi:mRNA-degrading endonuclease RelE of RelBE toxin-antitoxin system